MQWNGNRYNLIRMQGKVTLTNHTDKTVYLEIKRSVLGNVDEADHEGRIVQAGQGYDGWAFEDGVPFWWSWYNWPWWWYHFNTVGQVTWDCTLDPSDTVTLTYQWHYYWLP